MTDPAVLEQNYKYKMLYSPDYRDREPEKVCQLPAEYHKTIQITEFMRSACESSGKLRHWNACRL